MKKFIAVILLCASVAVGTYSIYPLLSGNNGYIAPQPVTINKEQHLKEIFPSDSRQIFDASQNITLYSLNPDDGGHIGKNTFHDYKVLGSSRISGDQIKNLRLAFHENIGKHKVRALCFWPHHGIRAQHKNKIVDFVICFHCGQIYSYYGGKKVDNGFSADARVAFNDLFNQAGLEIKDEPFGPRR